MGKFYRTFRVTAALAALAFGLHGGDAYAAVQGSAGTSSTGSLNFSVTKPARVCISNLTDMVQPNWIIGDGPINFSEDVCIYSTRPSGGYTVTATGSGSGGDFTLSNGSSSITYAVAWNAGGVNGLSNNGVTLYAGAVSSAMTGAATDSSSCSGATPGPTARLLVSITNSQMVAAPSGSYTGSLTLLITPN